ncbi:hypothetical protein DWF00_20675 [Bosea caraganae]|uniref:Extracellular solute-binding protein n=1 Tax=Bosea caraganae TaxID=2763117 RepID=A0A370KZ71_9HYPH|nr:hypothetical protein [Bosea caraganae]RDJ19912.1 hypothetical protein DWE98_27195 [Bosea caraganae]RDJ23850.1 hypothetical protein DWF00_20675 [Bosea caraganae]
MFDCNNGAASSAYQGSGRVSRRAVLAGGTASLLAAATASRVKAAAEELFSKPLSPLLAELYERAKPESQVTIWAAGTGNLFWLDGTFVKRFPAIKLNSLGARDVGTRIIAESRAGRNVADVWSHSLGGSLQVQERGIFDKVDWASLGVNPNDLLFDGKGAPQHNFVYTPIFLNSRLAETDRPRKWTDLTENPFWHNKMVSSTFHLPRVSAFLALEWGEERTIEWLRMMLEKQKTLITTGEGTDFLTSGERILAPGESTGTAFRFTRNGLEMGHQVMDIVPATQFVLCKPKAAPHPNAANLLLAWLLSPEGKELNETVAGWSDIRSNSASPLRREIAAAGSKILFEDTDTMQKRADYYKNFSDVVRGLR